MRSVLRQTESVVQQAGHASIWAGDASRSFQNVNARYQAGSDQAAATMQEVLQSVNAAPRTTPAPTPTPRPGLRSAGGGLNL